MTLYDIEQSILECVDEDGEIIDVEKLNELQMAKETKIDNIICLYKQKLADAGAIKQEKNILDERQKAAENQAEKLKQYISDILCGQKFITSRNKVSWRKSEQIEIVDESLIPDNFMKIVEKRDPIKDEIKKAIKNGAVIQGAELIAKNNIQIK